MIALPAGTRIWLAAGVTHMRCGFQGLAAKVQTALKEIPLGGHLFIFRGRRGDLVNLAAQLGVGVGRRAIAARNIVLITRDDDLVLGKADFVRAHADVRTQLIEWCFQRLRQEANLIIYERLPMRFGIGVFMCECRRVADH